MKPPYADVIDMTRLAVRSFEDLEARERRRRHNPLYWIERAFLATLRFPPYVIGAVVGVAPQRINGSVGATVLHRVGEGDDIVAQLSIGDAAFWVAGTSAPMKRLSPRAIDGATSRTLLVVETRTASSGGRSPPARPSRRP